MSTRLVPRDSCGGKEENLRLAYTASLGAQPGSKVLSQRSGPQRARMLLVRANWHALWRRICPGQAAVETWAAASNPVTDDQDPSIAAAELVAMLHAEVYLDMQVCAWAAGCFPSMLSARVGPDEEVRPR